jgi:hypothetical protein
MRGVNHTTQELRGELIADENPLRKSETLCDDQELVFIGKIEQRIVEQHHSVLMLLQQLNETSFVNGSIDIDLAIL